MTARQASWVPTDNGHVLLAADGDTLLGRVIRVTSRCGVKSYWWSVSEGENDGVRARGRSAGLRTAKTSVERHFEAATAEEKAYVYVLSEMGGRRTYVGWTVDVAARLETHNRGLGARATRGRRWRLAHVEEMRTRRLAMAREVVLKRDRALRRRLARQAA